jgi:hypothetical protein
MLPPATPVVVADENPLPAALNAIATAPLIALNAEPIQLPTMQIRQPRDVNSARSTAVSFAVDQSQPTAALTFSGCETTLPSVPSGRETLQSNGLLPSTVLNRPEVDVASDGITILPDSDSGQPLLRIGRLYSLYISFLDANDDGPTARSLTWPNDRPARSASPRGGIPQ